MCKMFGITLGTLYRWRTEGMPYIGSHGAGLSIFYDENKVIEWLSNREVVKKKAEKKEIKETIKDLYED